MIIWRPLAIVFGALPATWLCFWAVLGMAWGFVLVFEGVASAEIKMVAGGILMLGWGSLGVYGTVSLWAVGLGFDGARWRRGLMAGIIGAFPIVAMMVLSGAFELSGLAALMPTVIAVLWLIDFHGSPEPPIADDELERDLDELRSRGTSW